MYKLMDGVIENVLAPGGHGRDERKEIRYTTRKSSPVIRAYAYCGPYKI